VASSRPSAGGLRPWIVGGLVVGAALLVITLGSYALGRRSQSPASTTTTSSTAPTTTPAATQPTTSTAVTGSGDPAAGQVTFAQTCGGCHLQAGRAAGGVGLKLQGLGLASDLIATQIRDGGGPMPANLVSGIDLQNVVAYVLSIQH
jgi:mono/diheme cytochrome c family protein